MAYGGLFDFFIGLVEPLFPLFNYLFGFPFYIWEPYPASIVSMLFLSAVIAGIISSFYVILIDKEEYNQIREKQQDLQDKMKEAREEDDMEMANKYMKESMSMQKEFMMKSLKPMFASMAVFFIFIPWVLFSFVPVTEVPQAQQNGTYQGDLKTYGIDGSPGFTNALGEATIEHQANDTYTLILDGDEYEKWDTIRESGMAWYVQDISVPDEDGPAEVKLSTRFIELPFWVPLIGTSFEWLGTYIIFQIPFTIVFRKWLGVQ